MATAVLLAIGLLATGVAYAAILPGRAAAAEGSQADIEAGRKLFLANCATCHGFNAEGRTGFPSLIGVGAAAVDFQVGTARMPMQASGPQAPKGMKVLFSEDEIRQFAAYVASLAPGPDVPAADAVDPTKGDPAKGLLVFRTNCAMCHNFAGKGGALRQGKSAPNLTGVTPTHVYEAMETGPQNMPVFNDQTITPDTKRDVIAFLNTINSAPNPGGLSLGAIGPVSEGLVAWVVGLILLIGCAVWLGSKAS
jgi:ubiquinol-cytochrome c reductase cytochrome c subunit